MTTRSRAQRKGRGRGGRSLLSFDVRLPRMPRIDGVRARWTMGIAAGVVAFVVLAAAADVAASWGRIHPGVTVGGVELGGMTPSAAREALLKETEPRLTLPVTVAHGSRRWTVTDTRIGARFAPQRFADSAYAVGRTGGAGTRLVERIGAWFGRSKLPLAVDADPGKLDALIADLGSTVYVEPHDAAVEIRGTDVTRAPAEAGARVMARELRAGLLSAFVAQNRIVKLPVESLPARVADADADHAFADAQRMISGDLTLTWEQKSWTYPAQKLAEWIKFRPVPFTEATATPSPTEPLPAADGTANAGLSAETTGAVPVRMVLQAYVSAAEVSSTLQPVLKGLGRPAKDARFKVSGKRVSVVPGQVGTGVDMVGLSTAIDGALKRAPERTVAMRLTETQPKLTTERAKAMGVRELISSYTTDYDPGNAPRVSNIHTLARALDGKLVPPGGTFSFNQAVGERTAEKGYQEAPAIVKGKLVPQLGGGICQIGTTFFNAVFFSGFPVAERTNHSFYISHYPKGRDCTVSWGGPDFRWKNDSKAWVLIKTGFSSDSVTISLYGTDPGYKVDYTTGPFTSIVAHKTVEEKDPKLAVGERRVKDSGVDGRRVVVVRTVTLNGAVVRKDTFSSYYRPKDEVVRVGSKAVSAPATQTPSPGT